MSKGQKFQKNKLYKMDIFNHFKNEMYVVLVPISLIKKKQIYDVFIISEDITMGKS